MKRLIIGGLATLAIGLGIAAPATADYDTTAYGNALDAAGLIDYDGPRSTG